MVGREQRLGLGGRERLDPERGGGGHQRAVEAVGVHERRAAVGIVVGEVERRLRLAGDAQRPAVAMAHEAGRIAARRQFPQQRLGPEMLVDVDSRGRQRTIR